MSEDHKNKEILPVDLVIDYGELGLKETIEHSRQYLPVLDQVSTEIPYVKTLIAAIKIPRTISDLLLGAKINEFLYASGLDEEKISKLQNKLNKTKREKLWERVVLSINAHDDKQKSRIIGKLFFALVNDEISLDEFFDMTHATNSLNLNTLEKLKNLYSLEYTYSISASLSYSFATLGLIDINNSSIGSIGGGGPYYPLNQTGWKYVGIIYDHPDSSISNIKIGVGDLVIELNEDWSSSGKAYPFEYILAKGTKYMEVDLFVINSTNQILCEETTKLPKVIGSSVVLAGLSGQTTAENLAADYPQPTKMIRLRNMEDEPKQKWAALIKLDEEFNSAIYLDINDIEAQITNNPEKTDYTRYLMDILNECKRVASGEI